MRTFQTNFSYSEISKRQGNFDYKEVTDTWDCSQVMRFTESIYTWHKLYLHMAQTDTENSH